MRHRKWSRLPPGYACTCFSSALWSTPYKRLLFVCPFCVVFLRSKRKNVPIQYNNIQYITTAYVTVYVLPLFAPLLTITHLSPHIIINIICATFQSNSKILELSSQNKQNVRPHCRCLIMCTSIVRGQCYFFPITKDLVLGVQSCAVLLPVS